MGMQKTHLVNNSSKTKFYSSEKSQLSIGQIKIILHLNFSALGSRKTVEFFLPQGWESFCLESN